jgi:hypothetical protein
VGKTWGEEVVVYFKLLSGVSPGWTVENHEDLQVE